MAPRIAPGLDGTGPNGAIVSPSADGDCRPQSGKLGKPSDFQPGGSSDRILALFWRCPVGDSRWRHTEFHGLTAVVACPGILQWSSPSASSRPRTRANHDPTRVFSVKPNYSCLGKTKIWGGVYSEEFFAGARPLFSRANARPPHRPPYPGSH